ncbi:peptidase T [Clostridium tepidiprofundi DSM 19306]|uniref:Peptidase T n=1 Tax=Clostridium tepidiprofundi DSM 19306 TaxID=1121338 RepID=A0A151B4E4_9CLOT|nr:peptidase T [Clostridium tepidiprofundi]KYH34632.1 peptidase T [Clostridium tepidiprofundi DSM 19306]
MQKSKVVERFLKYVSFDTQSNEESNTVPTTEKQLELARELVKELEELGMSEVSVDDNGYVMATLPSNSDKELPTIGFMAHMDTAPDMSGANVKPKFVENYDGKDIILNDEKNIVLSPKDFPDLKNYIGKTLITTDGTTLLGADDKAGIAEIMTALEYLINNPQIKHGNIRVAFTPDEEVGRGPHHFDVEKFGADFAYTMDGGEIGEINFENFNAAGAKVMIHGRNVHPGSAKNKMVNSMYIASEFIAKLPKEETPENTEGYEAFYHLLNIDGNVEETGLHYIIRTFDRDDLENRKNFMTNIVEELNKKYGENTVEIEINDQYFNMKEKIEPVKHVVDNALKAMKEVGVEPKILPIRGGTDGAQLSFKGLPTPNLFAGGHNFHGKFEYVPTFAMEKAVEVIIKIVELYAE